MKTLYIGIIVRKEGNKETIVLRGTFDEVYKTIKKYYLEKGDKIKEIREE